VQRQANGGGVAATSGMHPASALGQRSFASGSERAAACFSLARVNPIARLMSMHACVRACEEGLGEL
jgi:hypothetical protein